MRQIYICLLFFALSSCTSPINRGRIWLGIGVTDSCRSSSWQAGLSNVADSDIHGVMLDLSLDPAIAGPAAGYQYYLPHPLDSVIQVLRKEKLPYGLRINWVQDTTAMSSNRLNNWLTDLSGLLLRSSDYPPEWIMFQGAWVQKDWKKGALGGFMRMMRSGWKEFEGNIWLSGTGRSPIFSSANRDTTADGWVHLVTGFPDEERISAIRSSTGDQVTVATTSIKVLSEAPAWSGYQWRVEQWLKADEGLAPVSDLYLTGDACGLTISQKEIERIQSFISGE